MVAATEGKAAAGAALADGEYGLTASGAAAAFAGMAARTTGPEAKLGILANVEGTTGAAAAATAAAGAEGARAGAVAPLVAALAAGAPVEMAGVEPNDTGSAEGAADGAAARAVSTRAGWTLAAGGASAIPAL